VESAAFLWLLRDAAVWSPHYTLRDLEQLDERIEAHLDGLRIAEDAGWVMSKQELAHGEPGEVFTAGVMAFQSGELNRIQPVLDVACRSLDLGRPLISALGWLQLDEALGPIQQLMASESPVLRRFGIAGAALHRLDPGPPLDRALGHADPLLRGRACQAAGEIGRRNLLPQIRESLTDKDEGCRFAAARAAGLLGDASAVRVLGAFAAGGGRFADEACTLGIRLFDEATALAAHRELAQRPTLHRVAVLAAGAAGYPSLVPWLFEQMRRPELARIAGEALTTITGLDLASHGFEGHPPDGFDAGPSEDPADDDVALDPDENLPWPNEETLQQWWSEAQGEFRSDTRYMLGEPVTAESLWRALHTGRQRTRAAAAIELALASAGHPLFEVRAPAFRQLASLRG
jgi:uncharacterized protein (TIGR02270 family)